MKFQVGFMTVFDRYITREFLRILGIALLAFLVIYLLVDIFDHIDTFIDLKAPLGTVIIYYLYMCPYIIVFTLPIGALMASLLSVGSMARNNELVAMKTSGVSLYRILAPLLFSGALLSIMVVFIGGWIVPEINTKLRTLRKYEIERKPSREHEPKRNLIYQDETGITYHVAVLFPSRGIAEGMSLISEGDGTVRWRIDAESGSYVDDTWNLMSGFLRVFDSETEFTAGFKQMWSSHLSAAPKEILGKPRDPEELGVKELRKSISRRRQAGLATAKQEVELNIRFSFPLAVFLMVLLGAPLASNPRRSGLALSFGISIAVSFAFFGTIRACQALGHHGTLPPGVAAWVPDIIFLAMGSAILLKVRK